jgi:hypothetical protein
MNDSAAHIDVVASRIAAEQDVSIERGRELATRIHAADSDIWDAAVEWAKSGAMPATPSVEGYSPATLGDRYLPSQVFTILIGLRIAPARARESLKRLPGRDSPPNRRA